MGKFSKIDMRICLAGMICLVMFSCKSKHPAKEQKIVMTPEQMDVEVAHNIKAVLLYAADQKGFINDSIRLHHTNLVQAAYAKYNFKNIWSSKEKFTGMTDSMIVFLFKARYRGLYPEDYHAREITHLYDLLILDSLARRDAILWTKADLLLTDAFMSALKDLKQGRIVPDSISIANKQNEIDSFFVPQFELVSQQHKLASIFDAIEPKLKKYQDLRHAIKSFVADIDTQKYAHIYYPYKDSLDFIKKVYQRIDQSEGGLDLVQMPDSLQFDTAVRKYQQEHSLVVDGLVGPEVVKNLNSNDREKFKKIATTLDRYKIMAPLPKTFIWVNIPSLHLEVWDDDSLVFRSKIIVGKPATPTPELTSAISNMVTFPTWTIPASIIRKEILPQLKKDPGYLARKGFNLFTYDGEMIDPYTVDWSKYTKGIPWKIVQGSGDDNALGIFKFNFQNPYDVYLHDTNQRYLFSNNDRALSHGCVRVQKWLQLADFIAEKDSLATHGRSQIAYSKDSLKRWIREDSRKTIIVKNRVPLYIKYRTCSVVDGKVVFYDDLYGKDEDLAQKYFPDK